MMSAHFHGQANVMACLLLSLVMGIDKNEAFQVPNSAVTTDAAFTIPRFFPGEIEAGSYPSPLHTIHVRSILSDEEVAQARDLAYRYAEKTGCWNQPDLERHATYSTCDFPVEENRDLAAYLQEVDLDDRIWTSLEELYGLQDPARPDYLDFFCSHYRARSGGASTKTMDRLEAHRDGSLLSFTVLLNDPVEFQGGGTFFDALRDVEMGDSNHNGGILQPGGVIWPQRAGDATFHSGKLLHGADVVTEGERTVLVGFVDVPQWLQRPGVLSEACRDWGRMDVAAFRHRRQIQRTGGGARPGWTLNNSRWIQRGDRGEGRSCLRGYVPAFDSVANRADPEYQRRRKLEAEDRLLRSILLPDGVAEGFEMADGDITVL